MSAEQQEPNSNVNEEINYVIEHQDDLLTEPTAELHSEEVVEEYTEAEQKAMELGWDPNFEGENKKTAEQYISEGEKIGLKKQVREKENYIKDLEAMIKSVKKRQQSLEEDLYNKALKDIEAKRRSAVELADAEAYDKYELEYQDLQKKRTQLAQEEEPESASVDDLAEVKAFEERNKGWMNDSSPQNLAMFKDACDMEVLIREKHPEKTTGEIFSDVENYIKSRYADYFKSNLRTDAPPMVPNARGGGKSRTPTLNDLTPSQKKVVNLYKDADGFDVQQYINELHSDGLIPGFKRSK